MSRHTDGQWTASERAVDCPWLVTSDAAWLASAVPAGVGNALLPFTVQPNLTGLSRDGTIWIENQPFVVTQAAGVALPTCEFMLIPSALSGTHGQIDVVANAECAWTASSLTPGLSVSPTMGTGPAVVDFTFDAAFDASAGWWAQAMIGGQTITLGSELMLESLGAALTVCIPPSPACLDRRNPLCWPLCFYIPLPGQPPPGGQPPPQPPVLIVTATQAPRGSVVFFSVQGTNVDVLSWRFASPVGNRQRQSNQTNRTWPATMVTTGTVFARVRWQGSERELSAGFTTVARPNFGFPAVDPEKVNNGEQGLFVGDPPIAPPPGGQTKLGESKVDQGYKFDFTRVRPDLDGPNAGFYYMIGMTNNTHFYWTITPQADSPESPFYRAQCGDYNPTTGFGFISGDILKDNIIQHESGSISGHYAYYRTAQGNPAFNLGVGGEAITAGPQAAPTDDAYRAIVNAELNAKIVEIRNFSSVEACGGEAERDLSCTFRGYINWSPYAACSF